MRGALFVVGRKTENVLFGILYGHAEFTSSQAIRELYARREKVRVEPRERGSDEGLRWSFRWRYAS